ncbi:glycosyltransferase, partial [Moraxella catarrhalis]|nr:glycosyltransferase [Moraxella catarrhalis]
MLKVSVITACFNSEKTIEDTILSVLHQTYKNIEYIIIDGASTDSTLEIIQKYRDQIACVMSEKDKGIYDAMNKGIKRSSGDIIALLNSDDFY